MNAFFQQLEKSAEFHLSHYRKPAGQDRATSFNAPAQPAGNLATQRLLRSGVIQPKLAINQPGDMYEQEADRVAEQMTNTKSESCHCGGSCSSCKTGGKASVQRKPGASPAALGSFVPDKFLNNLGAGQPLDLTTRAFFESRFGYDFSQVRIHTGSKAEESARAVNATAYTVGRDIVIGTGAHTIGAGEGKKLLAHELAHVVQQSNQGESQLQRTCAQNSDESFYQTAANYCKDTGFSGMLHPGQRCYREVPKRSSYWDCPPGDQVCFDEKGKCHDSYDHASPVESKESDGTCNLHGWCMIQHGVLDVIPGVFEDAGQEQASELMQCMDSCKNLGSLGKTFCEVECRRSSRLLP